MKSIYPILDESDIILFGTPIYWYGPTGPMKTLIDRLRPYIANRKLVGKKGAVISPSEEGPKCCEPMVEMFKMSFHYLGMEYLGEALAMAYERGEIEDKPNELVLADKIIELF
jgi:multimeric flavodoxin WrbA